MIVKKTLFDDGIMFIEILQACIWRRQIDTGWCKYEWRIYGVYVAGGRGNCHLQRYSVVLSVWMTCAKTNNMYEVNTLKSWTLMWKTVLFLINEIIELTEPFCKTFVTTLFTPMNWYISKLWQVLFPNILCILTRSSVIYLGVLNHMVAIKLNMIIFSYNLPRKYILWHTGVCVNLENTFRETWKLILATHATNHFQGLYWTLKYQRPILWWRYRCSRVLIWDITIEHITHLGNPHPEITPRDLIKPWS